MKLCPICRQCYEDTESICTVDSHGALVPSRPGSRIIADKYRLDRLLGRGGMGAVYVGTHIELERPAAIKLLLPDLVADTQALERFRREARAAARLNHPNVADTYDYGILPGGEAYIVMELVDGQTLREYLNVAVALECGEAAAIARQVADGVEVAHRNGIIHRDLKPSNIIISRDHHGGMLAKVVDFGIAKLKEHSSSGGTGVLTSTGSLVGTPRYMSPEQCAGHEIEEASDIYSLGVILYEMLAGHPPFDAASATAVAIKHVQQPPPPLKEARADVPDALAELVMQSLAKAPKERPPSAAELARGLRPFETPLAIGSAAEHDDERTQIAATPPPVRDSLDTNTNRFPLAHTSDSGNHETGQPAPHGAQGTHRAGAPTLVTSSAPEPESRAVEPEGEPLRDVSTPEKNITSFSAPSPAPERATTAASMTDASLPSSDAKDNQALPDVSPSVSQHSADALAGVNDSADRGDDSQPVSSSRTETNAGHVAHDVRSDARDVAASAPDVAHPAPRARIHIKSVLPTLLIYAGIAFLVVIGLGALWLSTTARKSTRTTTSEPTREQTPLADARPTTTQQPTPAATAAATPVVDSSPVPETVAVSSPEVERRALRATLDGWIAATNSRDINRLMSFYASKLDTYYRANNVSLASVQRNKEAVIGQASAVNISIGEPDINLRPDGRTASMVFRKQYVIEGGAASNRGEVSQELRWQKTNAGWKIISERDLRVIR